MNQTTPPDEATDKIKCCVCPRNINPDTAYLCDGCGGEFHPKMCLGAFERGSTQIPEDDYAYCKNCVRGQPHD